MKYLTGRQVTYLDPEKWSSRWGKMRNLIQKILPDKQVSEVSVKEWDQREKQFQE